MFDIFSIMNRPLAFGLWSICSSVLLLGLWTTINLIHHIRLARTIGLPFVVLPFSLLGAPWQLAQFIVVPVVKSLPKRLTQNWLPFLLFNEFWHNGYEPFEQLKTDTFLAVSPGQLILYTCDPDVNVQLFRDGNFGKPAELMSILNIYGPTITGTDGLEARLYRKITGPFFSENTLRRVFTQSVSGGKILLAALMRPDAHRQLRTLSARLSINTLCQVAFNYQTDSDLVQALAFQDNKPDVKAPSYNQALHGFIKSMGTVFLVPHWILRLSPIRTHNHALACYSALRSYMNQLKRTREDTLSGISMPGASTNDDLLHLLIQANTPCKGQDIPVLTNTQVIGQIFLFMFAGHEANANVLVSIILLLACHPETQVSMQRDLDRVLGQTCSDTWSYDHNYNALMHTTLGGVIYEALRLFTVLPILPKRVPPETPWLSITVQGQHHHLPANTITLSHTSATHRHPKHWPKRPEQTDQDERSFWSDIRKDPRQRPYAAADFDPSRWTEARSTDETTQMGSANFLKPRAGTFIPFSEGGRGCLGRRFALVEVCAVVAMLFKTHSVELMTDLGDGSGGEKKKVWLEARRRAALALSEGTKFDTSLRVTRDVPIRFVPRNDVNTG